MNGKFREALNEAVGQSEFVIVVFVDIRGFSKFSKHRESPDTAMYIKRVYTRLIDEYFPSATFYKPTGDGLLIVMSYDHKTLADKCKEVIQSCSRCHNEFADICKGDPMINFDVPSSVGIGVARGTACRLKSGDTILDYSGHILNLASRLMNLARPSGIVIDGAFGFELLSEDQRKLFVEDNAYLRSIAEDTPIKVYILKDVVSIPPENKQPLAEERWEVIETERTVQEWQTFKKWYRTDLNTTLKRPDAIEVFCTHPVIVEGKLSSSAETSHQLFKVMYYKRAGQPCIGVDIDELMGYLASKNVPPDTKVRLSVGYVPKPR